MHFTKLVFASLATFAIASPISEATLEERAKPNNVNITIDNINDISNKIHIVNKTLNDFYPGSKKNNTKTALLIESQSNDINAALKNATTYVRASRVWNQDDSFRVADVVLNRLVPSTYQLLQKLTNKNHTFKNNVKGEGDTRPRVKGQLLAQEQAAGVFGNATRLKLAPILRDAATNINQDIMDHFETAIAAFSGP